MATLAVTEQTVNGSTLLPLVAAAGGGDAMQQDGDHCLVVNNADATSTTVTVHSYAPVGPGEGDVDLAVVVAAGERRDIGPFSPAAFVNPATGLASITYSKVTSLTVGVRHQHTARGT